MGDILIATSINSKIFYEGQSDIFDELTTKELLDTRANIRNEYTTIIVGGNTIKKDNPTLLNTNKNNIRVIIDKYADLDIDSKIFRVMPHKTYLILLRKNKQYEDKLTKLGVNILYLEHNNDKDILKIIKKISIGKILIEGGTKTIRMFLKNHFVDYIKIVQFPVILPSNSLDFESDSIINCKLKETFTINGNYIYQCYKVEDKND